jgi:hypothetical protein
MKYALLATLALVLAPIAQAQDCTPLERVMASGLTEDFDSLMGDETDDGFFETDISFFDADACAIDAMEPLYYCMWARRTVAEADKAMAPLYDLVKVCLSAGWKWDDMTGQTSADGAKVVEGFRMTKRAGAHAGAFVQVYMDAEPDEPSRLVWLEVGVE